MKSLFCSVHMDRNTHTWMKNGVKVSEWKYSRSIILTACSI